VGDRHEGGLVLCQQRIRHRVEAAHPEIGCPDALPDEGTEFAGPTDVSLDDAYVCECELTVLILHLLQAARREPERLSQQFKGRRRWSVLIRAVQTLADAVETVAADIEDASGNPTIENLARQGGLNDLSRVRAVERRHHAFKLPAASTPVR
jgi:hypothetical protein